MNKQQIFSGNAQDRDKGAKRDPFFSTVMVSNHNGSLSSFQNSEISDANVIRKSSPDLRVEPEKDQDFVTLRQDQSQSFNEMKKKKIHIDKQTTLDDIMKDRNISDIKKRLKEEKVLKSQRSKSDFDSVRRSKSQSESAMAMKQSGSIFDKGRSKNKETNNKSQPKDSPRNEQHPNQNNQIPIVQNKNQNQQKKAIDLIALLSQVPKPLPNNNKKDNRSGVSRSHSSVETGRGEAMVLQLQQKITEDIQKRNISLQLMKNIKENMHKKLEQTKKKKQKAIYRFNKMSFKELNRIEKDFQPCWEKKIDKIHQIQKDVILNVLDPQNDPEAEIYQQLPEHFSDEIQDGKSEEDITQSKYKQEQIIDTLSSTDERDLTLLIRGEHRSYFEAKEEFQEIQFQEQQRNNGGRTERFCFCLGRRKQLSQAEKRLLIDKQVNSMFAELSDKIKKEVKNEELDIKAKKHAELHKNIRPQRKSPQKDGNIRRKITDIFMKDKVYDESGGTSNDVESFEVPQPRTGKELWAIARRLVYQEIRRKDLGFNMMEALRRERNRKAQELKEKNEQQEKERIMKLKEQQAAISQNDEEGFPQGLSCIEIIEFKFFKYYSKLLLYPDNKRLRYFHLLVALTLFFDFFLTGLIMGNYLFITGQQEDFINHHTNYIYICLIQSIDILLNFFKSDYKMKSREIFSNYLKGNFVTDLIAVLPYSILYRPLIFLRYLKLLKYNVYLTYFEDFVLELCKFMNYKQLQLFKSMFRLLFQLSMVSHLFASFWCMIGNYLHQQNDGWIQNNYDSGIQKLNFGSIYITSLYWVITTFTSIGYGDVYGHTILEYMYQILVEMVGMCFFGYMMGTFQQLIQDLANDDPYVQQQDQLDQWFIKLNKIVKERALSPVIFKAVENFYQSHYKLNPMVIMDNELFDQLKPRLQKHILDSVFDPFYKKFETIFEGCELAFQREVFMNCEFDFFHNELPNDEEDGANGLEEEIHNVMFSKKEKYACGHTYMDHVWYDKDQKPVIIQQGTYSDKIYLILSGPVYIMDGECQFEYGILQNGSYFGDISMFFDEPNQFSYAYSPYQRYPSVQCLAVDNEKFMKICRKYPLSFEILLQRAYKRKKAFERYRATILISLMKGIMKSQKLFQKLASEMSMSERNVFGDVYHQRKNLYQALYNHYQANLIQKKKTNLKELMQRQMTSIIQKQEKDDEDHEEASSPLNNLDDLDEIREESCSNSSKCMEVDKQLKKSLMKNLNQEIKQNNQIIHKKSQRKLHQLIGQVKKDKVASPRVFNDQDDNEEIESISEQSSSFEIVQNKKEDEDDDSSSSVNLSEQEDKIHGDPNQINQSIMDQSNEVLLQKNRNSMDEHLFRQKKESQKQQHQISQQALTKHVKMPNIKSRLVPKSAVMRKNEKEMTLNQNKSTRYQQQAHHNTLSQTTSSIEFVKLKKDNFLGQQLDNMQPSLQPSVSGSTKNVANPKIKIRTIESETGQAHLLAPVPKRHPYVRKLTQNSNNSNFGRNKGVMDEKSSLGLQSKKDIKSKSAVSVPLSKKSGPNQTSTRKNKSKEKGSEDTSLDKRSKANRSSQSKILSHSPSGNRRRIVKDMFYEGGGKKENDAFSAATDKFSWKKKKFNPQLIVPEIIPVIDQFNTTPQANRSYTPQFDENNSGKLSSQVSPNIMKTQKKLSQVQKRESQMIQEIAKSRKSLNRQGSQSQLAIAESSPPIQNYNKANDDSEVFSYRTLQTTIINQMSDSDLLKIIEQQLKENIKNYLEGDYKVKTLKKSKDFTKQLKLLNTIVDEFLDVNSLEFIKMRGHSPEFFLARYLKLIDYGKFPRAFIPKSFSSVLSGRKRLAEKNRLNYNQMDQQAADEINNERNIEHMITYKLYQDEQVFFIKHTDHQEEEVKDLQSYLSKAMARQIDTNNQFKQIYDRQIDKVKADIALWKQNVTIKLLHIQELQHEFILKKRGIYRSMVKKMNSVESMDAQINIIKQKKSPGNVQFN